MEEKHTRYIKRAIIMGAGLFSGLAVGFLFIDWIRTGNIPSDFNAWLFLGFGLVFLFGAMLILADDLYRKKK